MSSRGVALWATLIGLAFGLGLWAGWAVQAQRIEAAHQQAVAWVEATDSAHRVATAQVDRQRLIAQNEARRAQQDAATSLERADAERDRRQRLTRELDSLRAAQPLVPASPDVAVRDSVLASLTVENASLRTALDAQIRASAQLALVTQQADSMAALWQARAAALEAVVRRPIPTVSRGTLWSLLHPSPLVTLLAGAVVGVYIATR